MKSFPVRPFGHFRTFWIDLRSWTVAAAAVLSLTGGLWGQAPSAGSTAATRGAAEPVSEAPADLWTRSGLDWPAFLGPTGDSKSREAGPASWPEDGPRILWQRRLGDGYGIGSVARGRFYQADRVGDETRLVCLNAETGEELWKFTYPTDYTDLYGYDGGPRCSPVVDGDRVYLLGVAGMLHCVDAASGELKWKVDTFERFGVVQNFFGVGSTPVIHGDLLIALIGGSPAESRQLPPGALDRVVGNGSAIVAFDKRTGEVRYQASDELASYASPRLASIGGRDWGFAFCRGGLVGFEPASGKIDFHYPWRARLLESVNAATPVVVGDEVLISETYGPGSSLLKVRPGGYDVVWKDDPRQRAKSLQAHWNTPVYHEGFVYGCSGRNPPANLRCLDWKTGEVQWEMPPEPRCSLLYLDGHFICQYETGELRVLRANSREPEIVATWILRDPEQSDATGAPAKLLKYPAWSAPIYSHGLLYVRGRDRLVCLELRKS